MNIEKSDSSCPTIFLKLDFWIWLQGEGNLKYTVYTTSFQSLYIQLSCLEWLESIDPSNIKAIHIALIKQLLERSTVFWKNKTSQCQLFIFRIEDPFYLLNHICGYVSKPPFKKMIFLKNMNENPSLINQLLVKYALPYNDIFVQVAEQYKR